MVSELALALCFWWAQASWCERSGMQAVNIGLDPSRVVTMRSVAARKTIRSSASCEAVLEPGCLESVKGIPGVEFASVASGLAPDAALECQ